MPNLSQTRVAQAMQSRSKLDVSSTHVTTGSWFRPQVVYYRHMIGKEHLKGSAAITARVAPMAVPTYGRARINLRHFFVPYRVIFPNWNEFIVDTIASSQNRSSLVAVPPIVKNNILLTCLIGDGYAVDGTEDNHDIIYSSDGVASSYASFTDKGRWTYSLLRSLGYGVNFNGTDNTSYNALGLLAYAKVFFDWYSNSAYMDSNTYLKLDQLFHYNDPQTGLSLSSNDCALLFDFAYRVCYDSANDYITSAWDNPVSPNSGLSSLFALTDVTLATNNDYLPTSIGQVNTNNSFGTPNMVSSNSKDTIGTTYLHQALKSMTDYVKRHQLSGARVVDRALTQLGVQLDSAKLNRSIYIGYDSVDLQISDIMSTANTSNTDVSNLGDYAGRGFAAGRKEFDFDTDEYGVFLSVMSILPQGGYYQGIDRNNMALTKLDFFNSDFDNLGVQAIAKKEVYMSRSGLFGSKDQYNEVFGYCPRYAHLKVGRNFVSGDFLFPSIFAGGDSWHLFRKFTDGSFSNNIGNVVHSLAFTRGDDGDTYNRIFEYVGSDVDKFYIVIHTAAQSLAPCKSLFDTYHFEDNSSQVTLDANGTKVN